MLLRPRTVDEACRALAESPAPILSGGTDFFPSLGDRPAPTRVLDLSSVNGLSDIGRTDTHIRIGARVTWSALRRAELPPCFEALKAAAGEVGSVQIQNVATIAGNICNASPAADGAPPLLALDASVELVSTEGRRTLALADFLIGNRRTARRPNEILTAILVPRTIEQGRSVFMKLGARRYLVISIAMVTTIISYRDRRVSDARVAVGACSAVAQRLPALESALVGAALGESLGDRVDEAHLAALSPIGDVRGSAAYRRDAAFALVRRALDACVQDTCVEAAS